ncbi:MAG: alanine dehydrogenase [Arcticibacterium sp.]|jgi:alanine dehydrogenase
MAQKPEVSVGDTAILETKPAPKAVGTGKEGFTIGLPLESTKTEKRIALTPDSVSVLTRNGINVVVEKGAGLLANFGDEAYANAGAEISFSSDQVYACQIVIKVNPPSFKEIALMNPESALISALQFNEQTKEYFQALVDKRITAIAFEHMEDTAGNLSVIRAMSEIAGSSAVLLASEYLAKEKGMLLGGIAGVPPTSVVILGAGTVAEFAARTALGLGADIKIFDLYLYRLQRLRYALGQHIFTSIIDSQNLGKALENADVVIGAIRSEKGMTPLVVTEEMVERMKSGSVIVDVAIDQGGCIETSSLTTHQAPVFTKHGVTHYAVPNIASRVGHTASCSLSNIFTPLLIQIENLGGMDEMILSNHWFLKGVYAFKGNITHQNIAKKFNLRHRDLRLLLAARI